MFLPIVISEAEDRYRRELTHELTAQRLFERRWATTLLDHVLERLGAEMTAVGKGNMFEAVKPALLGSVEKVPYAQPSWAARSQRPGWPPIASAPIEPCSARRSPAPSPIPTPSTTRSVNSSPPSLVDAPARLVIGQIADGQNCLLCHKPDLIPFRINCRVVPMMGRVRFFGRSRGKPREQ